MKWLKKLISFKNFELIYDYFEIYVFENDQRSHYQIFNMTKKNSFVQKTIS